MRYESDEWAVTCGVHIGHHHNSVGQNCQDSVAIRIWEAPNVAASSPLRGKVLDGQVFVCGVVCDGCGGADADLKHIGLSGHSEVGANLISDMIVRNLAISAGGIPLVWALENLFGNIKRYIDMNMSTRYTPEEMVIGLQQFWLTTINGFIMCGDEGYLFACGDGCYQTDDDFYNIDQQDKPHYLAYACCPSPERFGISPNIIPSGFVLIPFDPNKISRIMVATDGFLNHDATKMEQWQRTSSEQLPGQLHGQQWEKTGRFGLKKWMNTRYARGYFNDDCAIVVAERKTKGT